MFDTDNLFIYVHRETSVNLIMMQKLRRKRKSASFIYRVIVPKEKIAFTCIISFDKNVLIIF